MPTDTISKTIGVVTELTVIAPLKEGCAARLRQVLTDLQTDPDSPIKQIDTIHFRAVGHLRQRHAHAFHE